MTHLPVLALHGGSGIDPTRDYTQEKLHMAEVAKDGRRRLVDGAPAVDVVTAAVEALELAGLYIAGRGSSPNVRGTYELDGAVMDGDSGRAGGVAGLVGYASPVRVARAVMDATPHTLLVGEGAAEFAATHGMAAIPEAASWFKPTGLGEIIQPVDAMHGTVGCVALDKSGRLASATSTGGTFGKTSGRVGDTPIVGAGLWADCRTAVACTGLGEYFYLSAAAVRVAHRLEFTGAALKLATAESLSVVAAKGGAGGLVAIDATGAVSLAFVGTGMKCAVAWPEGNITSHVFALPPDFAATMRTPREGAH